MPSSSIDGFVLDSSCFASVQCIPEQQLHPTRLHPCHHSIVPFSEPLRMHSKRSGKKYSADVAIRPFDLRHPDPSMVQGASRPNIAYYTVFREVSISETLREVHAMAAVYWQNPSTSITSGTERAMLETQLCMYSERGYSGHTPKHGSSRTMLQMRICRHQRC